jgi:hypothetical protein
MIERADLERAADFEATRRAVEGVLTRVIHDDAELLRFFSRYTAWNGLFGAGVSSLAGKIARSRRIFLDPEVPIAAAADRSVLVASYIFDAAIDEFDDRSTRHRDTHRCLAQALLVGLLAHADTNGPEWLLDADRANAWLDEPDWLRTLCDRVAEGYGRFTPDTAPAIFFSMGYHLGSEVLADQEFSTIDARLNAERPELVRFLEQTRVDVGGEHHEAWKWVRVHSGHGGGAEAMHFDHAVRGVRLAFAYVPAEQHAALRAAVLDGFRAFADDHAAFFASV